MTRCNCSILIGSLLCGCASLGSPGISNLEVHSLGLTRVVLDASCPVSFATTSSASEGELWLTDIPLEDLLSGNVRDGQVLHLELLWRPKAGQTPLDATATNVAIRHVIFADEEVGVYSGGGYGWPSGSPDTTLTIDMEDATMSLQVSTSGFVDLLSPATVTGRATGTYDAQRARQLSIAIDDLVSEAIGRRMVVEVPR